jgi:Transglycosylase SLT domain/LysM domain
VTDTTPPPSVDPAPLLPPTVPEPTRRRHHPRVLIAAGVVTVAALGALLLFGGRDGGPAGGSGDERFWPSRYHVRPGDTITSVADLHAQDVDDLLEAFDLTLADSLEPGTELDIPPLDTEGRRWPDALAGDATRAQLHATFQRWADEFDLPAPLLEALAWIESRWNNDSITDDGELGIGHLDPDIVGWLNNEVIEDPIDPRSPDGNIHLTAAYLDHLLEANDGDHAAALVAYHRGATDVYDSSWDLDVVGFVARVLAKVADFGAPPPASATPPSTSSAAPTTD